MDKFEVAKQNLLYLFNIFTVMSIPALLYILHKLVDETHRRNEKLYIFCWTIVIIWIIIIPFMAAVAVLNQPELF